MRFPIVVLFSFASLLALGARAQERPSIEPEALQLLQEMSAYLADLEQFSFHVEETDDRVLPSGQLLQFSSSVDVYVRRPDRLRAKVSGDIHNQELLYDGETITLLDTEHNTYGTLEAPDTIESALDHARAAFELEAPLSEIVYRNLYEILIDGIDSGFYVGLHTVAGVHCHHLAFRQQDIDWQVWIAQGEKLLPRKVVITRKRLAGAPQFSAILSDWSIAAQFSDGMFTFSPPEGAVRIEFLRTGIPETDAD